MTDSLIVLLGGRVAGTVTRQGQRLRFDYDVGYQNNRDSTPLSLSMPITVRSHGHEVINPWMWNLLPDNELVLRRWAREFQVSASSAFSLLSSPVGEDCAGAVQFASPGDLDRVIGRDGSVEWLSTTAIAQRLRDLDRDQTAWLGSPFTGQFSLAGAQAKTALLYEKKRWRWGIPSGPIPTTHILKPAVVGFDDHDLNEHLCLDAAGRAGLVVAASRVDTFADESAVVVTRYDRVTHEDGSIQRVHQEDLCQALGVPPSQKYQNAGGPTPRQIARMMRDSMPLPVADEAVWRFADALIWNWLIGGTDAHAKNYSLLLSGSQVRLAPLYDVASMLPYGDDEQRLRLAMKIGTSYELYPRRNRWPAAARDLGLDADELLDRVRVLAARVPEAFETASAASDVAALRRELPARLVELVADRSRRCLELIDGPLQPS